MIDLLRAAVEIAILFLFFYFLLLFLRGTRGAGILKGFLLFVLVAFVGIMWLTQAFGLERLGFLLREWLLPALVIVMAVTFQPEIRRAFVRLGASPLLQSLFETKDRTVEQVVTAVTRLSQHRTGALIAIEREASLRNYIEGGVRLDARVTSELIESIFYPGSALHDGAIIVQEDRVAAAGCLFPLTDNLELAPGLGTRHRAAIGITEESDAVSVVVSEETGRISLGIKGSLRDDLDREALARSLRDLLHPKVPPPDSTAQKPS